MRNKLANILLFLLAFSSTACKNDKNDQLYPSKGKTCIADTIKTVSFAQNIIPILTQNCALAGCHSGSASAGNLNMEASVAYGQLSKSGAGYINTADPKSSLLYTQLLSTADPMPPTYRLDSCSIKLILKWIQQKAPNN